MFLFGLNPACGLQQEEGLSIDRLSSGDGSDELGELSWMKQD